MYVSKAKTLWTVGPSQNRFLINDSAYENGSPDEQYIARNCPKPWEADWRVVLHVQNDAMFLAPSHHARLEVDSWR